MTQITDKGILLERLDVTVDKLNEGLRKIYGSNINLDPETPDGQLIGMIAQIKNDLGLLIQMNYQQLDPDLASGQWLNQRVAYAGLTRREASYSYLRSVIITGSPNVNLFKGFLVKDKNGNKWELVQDIILDGNGSARSDFRSLELGGYELEAGEELSIETIILGLNKIVTSNDSEVGVNVESDEELRKRFTYSHSKNGTNSVENILSNLLDLTDVKKARILENNTNEIDVNGVKGHTINAIVDGGTDESIAEIIYRYKGCGVGVQGDVEVILENHGNHFVYFDRPDFVDVYIDMTLVRYELFTEINEDEIKRSLTELDFGIGETVYLSRLYSTINITGGFYVKEIKMGRNGGALISENLAIDVREIARFLEATINIKVE